MRKLDSYWKVYFLLKPRSRKGSLYVRGIIELKLFLRRKLKSGRVRFFFNDPNSLYGLVYGAFEMRFIAVPLNNPQKDLLLEVITFIWDFSSPLAIFSIFFLTLCLVITLHWKLMCFLSRIALYDFCTVVNLAGFLMRGCSEVVERSTL